MKRTRIFFCLLLLLCIHQTHPTSGWADQPDLKTFHQLRTQAVEHANHRRYSMAITIYQKALAALPQQRKYACLRISVLYKLGDLWMRESKGSKALRMYRQAIAVSGCPQSPFRAKSRRAIERLSPARPTTAAPKVAQDPPPPSAPVVKAPRSRRNRYRPSRRYRRAKRKKSRRERSPRFAMPEAVARAQSGANNPKGKRSGSKKPNLQVWKRTKQNTILSRVSVGGGKHLKLEKLRISVQIEGMRVRTIVDHIYHNPFNRTLEGTFKYTLPADASVSYYAMFVGRQGRTPQFFAGKAPLPRHLAHMKPQQIARTVPHKDWGKLREARLVPAEKARQVYEEITRRKIDPALLEQDAPNTFSGRVFPIQPKGFNRVIMAYEQTLPQSQGHHVYRFRFPPDVAKLIDFSLGYNPDHSALAKSNLKAIRCRQKKQSHFVRCYWEQKKPTQDAVFYFRPKRKDIAYLAGIDPLDNQKYLLAQVQVKLPTGQPQASADQAIFLLDTSLSAQPDLFAAHVALLHKILQKNKQIKRLNVLLFDLQAQWVNPKGWIPNNPDSRRKLMRTLQDILLEGATDLSAAMRALAKPSWPIDTSSTTRTDLFVLSDGQISWGNRQIEQILYTFQRKQPWGKLRTFAYQMGIGAENLPLLRRLVRGGGALFSCFDRSALDKCAAAHTTSSMWLERVEIQGINATQVMVAGRQSNLFDGALLTIASGYQVDGNAKITLHGQYMGKPFRKHISMAVKAEGDLGPRAWGEMAIAQLLELEDPQLDKLIIAYAQHFIIPNRLCSFLVLETDKEYKQYGLDEWKRQKKVKDLAQFLAQVWRSKGRPVSDRERWRRLIQQVAQRYHFDQKSAARAALGFLQASSDSAFELNVPGSNQLTTLKQTTELYRKTRMKSNNDFAPFVQEARRRLLGKGPKGDSQPTNLPGAIRALSCITELHPSNAQGLRLVGYYLRAWKQPALAAQLFWRVLQRRSFEPHAFRDVAISMARLRRYGIAAAMYEVILAGKWHSRFGRLKTLAREEYALLQSEAAHHKALSPGLQRQLQRRTQQLGLKTPRARLRVTVTWNTDNTDIDLWVTGPKGETCKYNHKSSADGGRLLQDITRGYGPERYQNVSGIPGLYTIKLHFYGHSSSVFGNETHASILIVQDAGTPAQRTILKNLVLKRRKSVVQVHQLKL